MVAAPITGINPVTANSINQSIGQGGMLPSLGASIANTFNAIKLPFGAPKTAPTTTAPAATPAAKPATTTTPPKEQATLSSSNIDQKNQDNTQKVNQLATTPTSQSAGQDGFVRNADQSFAEAPGDAVQATDANGNTTWQSGGMNYALGPSNGSVSSDPIVQGIYSQFTKLKGEMDALGAQQIAAIQNSFDGLIKDQELTNKGEEASLNSLLIRGGSLQTGSSGGIMGSQVSVGLSKIADLNAKEQAAVIAAQQAIQSNDMELLDKQLTIADESRKERQSQAQTLSDKIDTQRKTNTLNTAILDAMDSGKTSVKSVMDALSAKGITDVSAKDIADTIQSIQSVKNDPMMSTALQWAKDAGTNGADQATVNKALALINSGDSSGALNMLSKYLSNPLDQAKKVLELQQAQVNLENSKTVEIVPGTPQYKVAQDLAYGNLTMEQFRTLYSYSKNINQKLGIYQMASELNPNFNPAAFEMGFQFASNPKVRQQITSLDNVINVTAKVIEASDKAVRTGSGLNNAIISGGIALGNSSYSNMKLARIAYADELSGALGYGSATDMSREMGFDLTDPNLSAQQFKDGMEQVVEPFIQSKRGVLVNAMGVYGTAINNQASGAAGQGAGMVKFKDPATGEVRTFTSMTPADFQDAVKQGYTVVP